MWHILLREARQQFRMERSAPLVIAVIYLLLCVVIFFVHYALVGTRYVDLKEAFGTFWLSILALQYFVVQIVGALKISLSITRDRSAKRYDFEIMSGINEWYSILGRLLGAPLFCYFLFALSTIFPLFSYFAGGISGHSILSSYAIFFSSTFFFYSFAILASAVSRNIFSALTSTLLFILFFYSLIFSFKLGADKLSLFSPLLPFASLQQISIPSTLSLGDVSIPSWLAPFAFYLFSTYWLLVCAARSLKLPKSTALSKPHAFILLSIIQCVIVATSSVTLYPLSASPFIYLSVSFIFLLLFAFLFIHPLRTSKENPYHHFIKGLLYSKGPYIPFFLVTVITTLLILVIGTFRYHSSEIVARNAFLLSVVMFLLMVLFFTLLVKFVVTIGGERGRLLAAFILLIMVALPPTLEVFEKEDGYGLIQVLNPLMVIASPLKTSLPFNIKVSEGTMVLWALILYGVLSLIMAAVLKMWWAQTSSEESR
ncbi:MAG: hypothetical protein N2234_07265 [Planctomycetota bacterium]|nr:hypothetical protein [Planctomycetota bacterium]